MTDVDLLQTNGSVGVCLGNQWEVSFNKTGTLGGNVKTNSGESLNFTDKLEVAGQYRQWNTAVQNN